MSIIKTDTGIFLYGYLIDLGFDPDQAKYITAQSAHETGNFSSPIFRNNNNLFGMKYAGQRLAKGEKNGHAFYNTIEDSIKDFEVYYKNKRYLKKYNSIGDYIAVLKSKGYFEAPEAEYNKGVNYFYNLYFGTV